MIDKQKAYALASLHSPCYVIDQDVLEQNYHRLLAAFKAHYDKVEIAYSYKTNYTPAICRILHNLGAKAEVVSSFEYHLACMNCVERKNIVYNGIAKSLQSSIDVLCDSGIVNIDNLRELEEISEYAHEHKVPMNIGLRLDTMFDDNIDSRFGIRTNSNDFETAKAIIQNNEWLNVRGVHSHYRKRTRDDYRRRVNTLIEASRCFGDIEYIDLGSGMFSPMEPDMKRHFDGYVEFEEYGEIAGSALNAAFAPDKRPTLILEPGIPLVSNAVSVVATVKDIKTDKSVPFVQVDCSTLNIGSAAAFHDVPIQSFRDGNLACRIVGFTCMEEDVLKASCSGGFEIGDVVVFKNCGAYSESLRSTFIMPDLPTYLISSNRISLVKQAETLASFYSKYKG